MTSPSIPDDVRRFVLLAIPSVPYLEALLLMRSAPGFAWDVRGIADRLYIGERTVTALLAELTATKIVERRDKYFYYRPGDRQLAELLDRLASAYSRNLVEITHLIHSKTDASSRRFADAFLFRPNT